MCYMYVVVALVAPNGSFLCGVLVSLLLCWFVPVVPGIFTIVLFVLFGFALLLVMLLRVSLV